MKTTPQELAQTLKVRPLSQQDYLPVWEAMKEFTNHRTPETVDEIWLIEHPPVFTLGQNGKPEHILDPGNIPVIHVDRGGQITYHGPGQLMMYVLLDLRRKQMGVRDLVSGLEKAVVETLKEFNITAYPRPDAPGVYVNHEKICSIGLRVRRGCSYHGIAFNVDMDLSPFQRINPCGYQNLKMTQIRDLGARPTLAEVGERLVAYLSQILGYTLRR